MPSDRDSHRIVIAGASSLLGAELKSLLEESRFAASDFRLLDEELAAGTLTEAGGEAAVIQAVEEGSFDRARFVFFTGSANFTLDNFQAAHHSGAIIIDLSGHSAPFVNAFSWFPGIDKLRGQPIPDNARLASIPSAAAEAAARLALSLRSFGLQQLTLTALQPVSAVGKPGVEELETQTSQLLSFQTPGKQLFDAQIAFNTLARFGPTSRFRLHEALSSLRTEVHHCLRGESLPVSIQLLHVPVFYGSTFSACAQLDPSAEASHIEAGCRAAGFALISPPDSPSNIGAAEQSIIQLSPPEADWPDKPGIWWFWGAADNIRLPAANAVKLADKLTS